MTLIATVVSRFGIIQASDSNITYGGNQTTSGPKVFALPTLNAALSLAGTYSVGGVHMDAWMLQAIAHYSVSPGATIHGFADYLSGRLHDETTQDERDDGSLIHIAGYVSEANGHHPEFWFVRNIASINDQTGEYEGINRDYAVTEDYWSRDRAKAREFDSDFRYFNGFTPGRITYHSLSDIFQQFLEQVWARPDWQFRRPTSLSEVASIVSLEIAAIGTLFGMSTYDAPYIGGAAQIEMVPAPPGAVLW